MYGWEVPWSWYQQLMSRFLRLRNLCSLGGTWMCITHSMRISHPLSNVITHLQVGYTAVIYILRKSNMAMENPLQLNLARKINEHHLYMFFFQQTTFDYWRVWVMNHIPSRMCRMDISWDAYHPLSQSAAMIRFSTIEEARQWRGAEDVHIIMCPCRDLNWE